MSKITPLSSDGRAAFRRVLRSFDRPSNGVVLFEGKSTIDGAPIVVVATGLLRPSANDKTGAMVQAWILRQDAPPMDAAKSGDDVSICGSCVHRGDPSKGQPRTCYVTLFQGPRSVWATWKAGGYPKVDARTARDIFNGANVRFGAYGDPAAVPAYVWRPVLEVAARHTGYTHRWRSLRPEVWGWLMASADSEADHATAARKGWRTFRVRRAEEPLLPSEVVCPAASEAPTYGRVTCATCGLCKGTSSTARKSVAIIVHGVGAASY